MNNERTVVLINSGDCSIGLADTQGRMYRLAKGQRMRISPVILQDILDLPGSRVLFREGLAQVGNITKQELLGMGLSDSEVKKILVEEAKPTVVITEDLEKEEEEIIPIEDVKEEIKEEIKEELKNEIKKTAPKKTTTKKTTTTKKSSKRK